MADTAPSLPALQQHNAPAVQPEPRRHRKETARSLLALSDQALVSGISFITTVLIGRYAGDEQLGLYSLGFTLMVVMIAIQDALITAPLMVRFSRKPAEERKRYLGHVLLHHVGLVVLAVAVFATIGLFQGLLRGWSEWVSVLLVLALVSPWVLLREFLRRLTFAEQNFQGAVLIDGSVAVLQIAGLGLLVIAAWLSAPLAFVVIGLASLLVSAGFLWHTRHRFDVCRRGVWQELADSWNFGRWLAAGQMISVVHGFVVYWLLGLLLGPGATGVFAACMTIVMLSNPLILGLGNAIGPRLATAAGEESEAAVRAIVWRSNLMMGYAMGAFAIGVALLGDLAMTTLYGPSFAGHTLTLDLLAVAFLVGSLTTATDYGLRAFERPDLSFLAGTAGLVVTVLASLLAIGSLGVAGCALGYLLGTATTGGLRLAFFAAIRATPQETQP